MVELSGRPPGAVAVAPSGSVVPLPRHHPGLPALAVQVGANGAHIESVAALCADTGLGAVLSLAPGRTPEPRSIGDVLNAFEAARGSIDHALVDANRYAGTRRVIGSSRLDPRWIDAQLARGQRYALTDSPYIPEGDEDALKTTLAQGRLLGDQVIVNLPISSSWLKTAAHRLRDAIDEAGAAVALTVEHPGDPMGVQAVVGGLVHVLGAKVPVSLLRCDASAVVALAYGAAGGAIGTTTALRHLYPLPKPDARRGGRPVRIAVWVPRLLAYMSVEKISDLVQHGGIDDYFVCDCTLCNGLRLDRIVDERVAFEHSIWSLTEFATSRFGAGASAVVQRKAFYDATGAAQFAHLDIESVTGVAVEPPAFLGAWKVAYERLPG